jgi:hypothetical protein
MRATLLCKHCDNELETDVYIFYLWDSKFGQLLDVKLYAILLGQH